MVETLRPRNADELAEALRWAAARTQPFEIVGGGSKAGFGRPVATSHRLDTGGLTGVVLYEPEELVITAQAGTSLAEIEAALAEKNQELAFEPADWRWLAAGSGDQGDGLAGTLGGVIACNASGPRRLKAGAARDHLLGFKAVSGRAEPFKSGGRVVKNVTGFDLSKLISGSFGTLAVLTEVTVRALPCAPDARTLLVFGIDGDAAVRAMTRALQSPSDVSGAAYLPADVAAASSVEGVATAGGSVAALRIEGPQPSVDARARSLRETLAEMGETGVLSVEETRLFWREVRDLDYFAGLVDRQIWRLSVPPSTGLRVATSILTVLDGQFLLDWGGGLIWLAVAASPDAGHATVRAALSGTGGHATLVRAEADVRARIPVFQPQPVPQAALTRRVKEAFDPSGLLNPGRMYNGI